MNSEHLHRYVAEFEGRHNAIDTADRMSEMVRVAARAGSSATLTSPHIGTAGGLGRSDERREADDVQVDDVNSVGVETVYGHYCCDIPVETMYDVRVGFNLWKAVTHFWLSRKTPLEPFVEVGQPVW
jgi:hypothetical protein